MAHFAYRPLTDTDLERFLQLGAYAFNADIEYLRSRMDAEARSHARVLHADDHLVAQLQLLPLTVMSGSGTLRCAGIAGVVTPPEVRRRGYAALLLRHACDELREQGMPLCMLYPFKRSFYHRYGWATFLDWRVYRGAPHLLARFRHNVGSFVPISPALIPQLQQIYTGALQGRFGPIVRDTAWWERNVLRHGKEQCAGFIWCDEQGVGRSYIIYRIIAGQNGERTLACREVVALDPTARAQVFAFMADHDAQCNEIFFRAPADAPVNLLLVEPLKCEVEPHFMLRLIDVAAALASYHYPARSLGQFSIAVSDDWLEYNQGVFALEVAEGRAQCQRLPDDSPADLSCDIRVLTQIYTRYLRPRTAAAFGMLTVHNRAALTLADQLFSGLAPFNSDFF